LTPPPGVDPAAVERLAAFWRLLGANVETMSAEHHDLVLGITSHLPHLIAYTIVGTADELSQVTRSEVLQFSAGGFPAFPRIAASDPTMWRDVFLANKDAVLEMLGRFSEDLATLTRAIRRGDGETLFAQFTRTRAIRRGIVEIGQDSPTPDFVRPHPDLPHAPVPRPYPAEDYWGVANRVSVPRAVCRSEQRRHHAHLERSQEDRAVSEANGERHRRLAVEHRALAERRDQTRRRVLARDPSEPGNQAVERAQRRADLPLRHDAIDLEHLEKLLDADDGHLQIAVEAAAGSRRERRGPPPATAAPLREARAAVLGPAVARLPFPQPHRPGFGGDVVHAPQHGRDLRIDRLSRQRMELVRHGAVEAQDGLDRGIAGSGIAGLPPMQLHAPRLEHDIAATAGIAHARRIEHERAPLAAGD